MFTRRNFLGSCAATAALLGGARWSLADGPTAGRRFLFITADGGWDPLCVFAPMFDSPNIDMESEAAPMTIGDMRLVDHPSRPTTRTFFENHHQDIVLLNGVSTRSVNHETCTVVAMTGSTSEDRPDWGTILGYAERDSASLPHLVVSGPSFPGDLSVYVSNAHGMLQPAIDRTLFGDADRPVSIPAQQAIPAVDGYLAKRGENLLSSLPDDVRVNDYGEALRRAKLLSEGGSSLQLTGSEELSEGLATAISALASGVSRVATVGTGYDWDTHGDNSLQTQNYEGLFAALEQALSLLSSTMGPQGTPLRDDTIIVVTSEMARTPRYNITQGRDHWPYTSMMLIGPGISGGRIIGGYNPLFAGIGVDAGGNQDTSVAGISTQDLGATLLELGDVDPAQYVSNAKTIPGVIA